ncbi:MAG: hypothetical protein WDN04_27415 [Rhodospirillales bacterium]
MTSFTNILGAAALAALALSGTAAAQAGEVQQRLDNQQQRIDQGIASGQLTRGEAARDETHLAADQAARNRDLAEHGGHLTRAEKVRLNQRLNHNSARVYDTKHNGVVRRR